jgi:hypothetical protein
MIFPVPFMIGAFTLFYAGTDKVCCGVILGLDGSGLRRMGDSFVALSYPWLIIVSLLSNIFFFSWW